MTHRCACYRLELRGLEREVAALLSTELDPQTQDALRRFFDPLPSSAHQVDYATPLRVEPEPSDDVRALEDVPDDSFANIGIDV